MVEKPIKRGRDSFSDDLLRHIDEEGSPNSIPGAEYFTVRATGKGGMSQSGLARFVGKSQSAISELAKKVRDSDPIGNDLSEPLKPFAGKDFNLIGYIDPEGREILDDGFCAAVIQHYACWARGSKNNTQAKLALNLIAHLGIRTLIHHKTGWQHSDVKDRIIAELQKEVFESHAVLEAVASEIRGASSLDRGLHNLNHNQSDHLNNSIDKIDEYFSTRKPKRKRGRRKRKSSEPH
jgi:hypothetical protein